MTDKEILSALEEMITQTAQMTRSAREIEKNCSLLNEKISYLALILMERESPLPEAIKEMLNEVQDKFLKMVV